MKNFVVLSILILGLTGCQNNEEGSKGPEFETLKTRNEALDKELAVLKQQFTEKEDENQNLRKEKAELLQENTKLQTQLAAKEGEIKTLREFTPPKQVEEKETSISFKTTEGQKALIVVGDHENLLERGRDRERETTINNLVPVETRVYQVPERSRPFVIPGPTPRPILSTQTCK